MTAFMFLDEFNPGVKSSDQAIYGLSCNFRPEDYLSRSTKTQGSTRWVKLKKVKMSNKRSIRHFVLDNTDRIFCIFLHKY